MKHPRKKNLLLAVGGMDPSGHAGVLADFRTMDYFGFSPHVALTALTIQSESKFLSWQAVPPGFFMEQLDAITGKITGIKIGMLATHQHAQILVQWIKRRKPQWVLWDPAWKASNGPYLLKPKNFGPNLSQLLKLTHLFTPNIPEAEWILKHKLSNTNDCVEASKQLFSLGSTRQRFIILKGGHLKGREKIDLVYDGRNILKFSAPTRPRGARGTGCSFGAALLSQMVLGKSIKVATRAAKNYVLNYVLAPKRR